MDTYRCVAIDDEDLALKLLHDFVDRIPEIIWIKCFDDAIEGATFLKQHPIDLLILDIHMPRLGGLELLEGLDPKPVTIISTSHTQYAYQSFQLDVIDYLLKPFTFERFQHAVQKSLLHLNKGKQENEVDHFWVHADYQMVKIAYDEVLFVEACKQYVKIYTDTEVILTLNSLKAMEVLLPNDLFVRIHKSYIVSVRKIFKRNASEVVIHDRVIPIGRAYRGNLG